MATSGRRGANAAKPQGTSTQVQSASPPSAADASALSLARQAGLKDHPILVIGGVAGAVFALVAGAFSQWVIPTRELALNAQIAELKTDGEKLKGLLTAKNAEIARINAKLVTTEDLLRESDRQLKDALHDGVFQSGSPYPKGWRAVSVGESVDAVPLAYPRASIEKTIDKATTNGVYVVVDSNNFFPRANYYFDARSKDKRITHIRFDMDGKSDFGDDFLRDKLRDALGTPKRGPRAAHYAWFKEKTYGVFLAEPRRFLILVDGQHPHWWHQE